MVGGATVYAWPWLNAHTLPIAHRPALTAAAGVVLASVLFLTGGRTNLALVHADMVAGEAQQFEARRDWLSQIDIYSRALRIRSTEDNYPLLLGYALLEQAHLTGVEGTFQLEERPTWAGVIALTSQDFRQMGRFDLLLSGEVILQRGREINPLNIDHTANLARLYRTWADLSSDQAVRQEMLEKSLAQYDIAVQLSPTMAHLWNEKGSTLQAHGDLDAAETAYLHSLELDEYFEESYMLLAALYDSQAQVGQSVEVLERGVAALEAHPQFQPSAATVEYLQVERQRLSESH
jgi:tetratricopeptide (TPR) repeat protein